MPQVELHDAYVWTCDVCGRDNFVRAVTVEMSAEDVQAMIVRYGGDAADYANGKWITRPTEVACGACAAEFTVEEPGSPE